MTYLPILLAIACPLMMILMMRGMHGHGAAPRAEKTIDDLKRERDALNDEISRAE